MYGKAITNLISYKRKWVKIKGKFEENPRNPRPPRGWPFPHHQNIFPGCGLEPKYISIVFFLGRNISKEARHCTGDLDAGAHAKALTRGLVIFGAGPSRARCLSAYVRHPAWILAKVRHTRHSRLSMMIPTWIPIAATLIERANDATLTTTEGIVGWRS